MTLFKERFLPWLAYPGVMLLAVLAHTKLLEQQQPLLMSTYAPVIMAALLVTLLEIVTPHKTSWAPDKKDVRNDALFMIVVQMVVPRLLAFVAVIALVEPVKNAGVSLSGLWPHQWSLASQVILMLVVVELFRYWLHRAAHNIPLLWRLHAVHHSPEKLYWLNVGRFHPIEKGLQFMLDALPFLLMGVSENVIAMYFVLYAINGFFQHSNIKLRFGWLNYLISSAELHRWHHSRTVEESNTNYGNNLIIWDLVFGSWFLPKDRTIDDIGLVNRGYPKSFLAQMGTPFVEEITDREVPMMSAKQIAIKSLLNIITRFTRNLSWWPLRNACLIPRQAQQLTLLRILFKNRKTKYATEFKLKDVHSVNEFRKRVPIQEYDDLAPYIREQIESNAPVITAEQPLFYAVTSGTTGSPKYLPVTKSSLKQYKEAQQLIVFHQFRQCRTAFGGRFLGIVSPSEEGRFENGMPYGAVSGFAYRTMPRLVRSNYILPPEIFEISDYQTKYELILLLALAESNITYVATANPSSLIRLIDIFNEAPERYVSDLERGEFAGSSNLPAHIQEAIRPLLLSRADRAAEIRERVNKKGILGYADLWPNLRMVTTWTRGSCGIVIKQLKNQLPDRTIVYELGYISSEFRGTIPFSIHSPAGIPTLTHHFYEFVEKNAWEQGERTTLTLDELQDKAEYYIIVTTSSGLYRYFMNDIVRVRGYFHRTPLLEFVQKGKGVTSITGEKLYEGQVTNAVHRLEDKYQCSPIFYLMIADEKDSRYRLYIETAESKELKVAAIARDIDDVLSNSNIEYDGKRKSGRLHKLEVIQLLPGAGEAYKQHQLDKGIREGQYKPVPLQYATELDFSIDNYRRNEQK